MPKLKSSFCMNLVIPHKNTSILLGSRNRFLRKIFDLPVVLRVMMDIELCFVSGCVLIRFVVHTPSPVDTGFPDIDPHRAGAQSTPYFAPFAGANLPGPPTLCTSRGGRGI